MDLDSANRKRDRRLRRRLLQALQGARVGPKGGLHARTLAEHVDHMSPPAEQFEGDGHVLGLLRDLENKGLATLKDERQRTWQRYGLDYLLVRITDRGSMLLNETAGPDPDVEDDRIPASPEGV
jgi:hypothetical protein